MSSLLRRTHWLFRRRLLHSFEKQHFEQCIQDQVIALNHFLFAVQVFRWKCDHCIESVEINCNWNVKFLQLLQRHVQKNRSLVWVRGTLWEDWKSIASSRKRDLHNTIKRTEIRLIDSINVERMRVSVCSEGWAQERKKWRRNNEMMKHEEMKCQRKTNNSELWKTSFGVFSMPIKRIHLYVPCHPWALNTEQCTQMCVIVSCVCIYLCSSYTHQRSLFRLQFLCSRHGYASIAPRWYSWDAHTHAHLQPYYNMESWWEYVCESWTTQIRNYRQDFPLQNHHECFLVNASAIHATFALLLRPKFG